MASGKERVRRNGLGVLLGLSLLGSIVVAVWSVCLFTWTLPKTDGAYGQAPFADPFVMPVMLMCAAVGCVIAFMASLALLRRVRLLPSFSLVTVISCVAVGVTVPFFRFGGVLAAFPVMVLAMVYCRRYFGAVAP